MLKNKTNADGRCGMRENKRNAKLSRKYPIDSDGQFFFFDFRLKTTKKYIQHQYNIRQKQW